MPRGRRGRPPANARTPTPAVPDDEDVEMEDQPDGSAAATPKEEEDEEDEDAATPAQATEESEAETSPVIQPFPRKRGRPGRPPKHRPAEVATPDPGAEDGSDRGTPARRGRGRPGRPPTGGFRGRPRGGPSHVTKVPVDKEGNMVEVIDDEVALPEDPEGETKVDKLGHLQGGRDYRVRVFTITGRGGRLYMLSTEPARCMGFRDSYLFFTKHQKLYKIIVSEGEKQDLIAREIIPHSYKGRAIGVVTARSVFREFGARIIIGGKRIIDDYEVRKAREDGVVGGELADPNDRLPPPGEPYNKNQYVAWHGASAVYHTGGPSVPTANGKVIPGKKRVNITSANWMKEHALAASNFNSKLTLARTINNTGVYDPHTNVMHYPKIMQPTHVRWEQLSTPSPSSSPFTLTNGTHSTEPRPTTNSIFNPPSPSLARNFLIVDTVFESAPLPNALIPGPDGDTWDIGTNGLSSVSPETLDELPSECREAFEAAKKREAEWKERWRGESVDGMRRELGFGLSFYPN